MDDSVCSKAVAKRTRTLWRIVICLLAVVVSLAAVLIKQSSQVSYFVSDSGTLSATNCQEHVSYAEKLIDPVAILTLFLVVSTFLLWRSTERLWIAGENALGLTERAFVFSEECSYELTTFDMIENEGNLSLSHGLDPRLYPTRFAVQPHWHNSGSTPAIDLSIKVDWAINDDRTVGTYRSAAVPFFVGPNVSVGSEFIEVPPLADVVQNGMPGILRPVQILLIWGRADYRDIFEKKHFTEWCYRIEPFRPAGERLQVRFIQFGTYNRTDRDDTNA